MPSKLNQDRRRHIHKQKHRVTNWPAPTWPPRTMSMGRLPGDIFYRGKNTTFYFPLATSILISVVLSLLLYLFGKWRR